MVEKHNNVTYFDSYSVQELQCECMFDGMNTISFKFTDMHDAELIHIQDIPKMLSFIIIIKLNDLSDKTLVNLKELCFVEYFNNYYIDSLLEDIERGQNFITWSYLPSICDIVYELYNNRNRWIKCIFIPTII